MRSTWAWEWRFGRELEWFLFPTLAVTRFENGSFVVDAHFLKLEVSWYHASKQERQIEGSS